MSVQHPSQNPVIVVNGSKSEKKTWSNGSKLAVGALAGSAVGIGTGLLADTVKLSTKAKPLKKGVLNNLSKDFDKLQKQCGKKWTSLCKSSETLNGLTKKWAEAGKKTKVGLKAGAGTAAAVVGMMTLYNFLFAKKDV